MNKEGADFVGYRGFSAAENNEFCKAVCSEELTFLEHVVDKVDSL